MSNKKAQSFDWAFLLLYNPGGLDGGKAGVDLAENAANDWAKDHQSCNDNNSDQNKN